jgi:hypothetical protein
VSREPCRKMVVRAAPGTESWAVRPEDARRIACLLTRDVRVDYWPRARVHEVWRRRHGQPLPVEPWSFRAWSSGDRATLFVDETETYESALWLLLHELAHLDLVSSQLLHRAYRSVKKPPGYLSSDAAHESHPEEQMANFVATSSMQLLGHPAFQYDRPWWRRRSSLLRLTARCA